MKSSRKLTKALFRGLILVLALVFSLGRTPGVEAAALDAVFANSVQPNRVCLGDGPGAFSSCATTTRVGLGLVDGDSNLDAVFAYSYYDDVLNEPCIKNRDRLWVGGEVGKKPNQEVVYRLARERGIDGVVMCWGTFNAGWATNAESASEAETRRDLPGRYR